MHKHDKRNDEESMFREALQRTSCTAERDRVEGNRRWLLSSAPTRYPARLRQAPPVIADKVIDLMRFVSRGTDEEKW